MNHTDGFRQRLRAIRSAIDPALLCRGITGIEKESLRTDSAGYLAKSPHPRSLGSALTNRYITTDFSEALLEFVTPAHAEHWQSLQFLCDLHLFTYLNLGEELLWVTSMPCRVGPDENIPLARYGSSNVGTMKTVYRRGLGFRYGRLMQTIAGIHFNFSIAEELWPDLYQLAGAEGSMVDFRSASYLGLIRNFRRTGWLVLYLFGASPAMCKSFIDDPLTSIPELDNETLFEPYATSLRMSDLGYHNKHQSRLKISLNSLDEYIAGLRRAITMAEPEYADIGVKVGGEYRQLNANILQIENEYYSAIRPKRIARSGERPTTALRRGGIEYVEMRSLDLNVFDPIGIGRVQAKFLETLLMYCLFDTSPPLDAAEYDACSENHALTARLGRDPNLVLRRAGEEIRLTDWAKSIIDDLAKLAALVDANGGEGYAEAIESQRKVVEEPERTPSARIVAELVDGRKSFFEFGLECAQSHKDYFLSLEPVNTERLEALDDEARASLESQAEVERADTQSFDEYLQSYFNDTATESGQR